MKYKNIVIQCKKEKTEELQKYLFRLKYSWIDNGNKHRHIKNFSEDVHIIISNDTTMHYRRFRPVILSIEKNKGFRFVKYPQFIRKEKLLKLQKV